MVYCPICGSLRIRQILPQIGSKYYCPECGYQGAFVVEDGEMAQEIRGEWLKDK